MRMMNRIEFHNVLKSIMDDLGYKGTRVFYNPPSNISLSYPCIIYRRDSIEDRHADNNRYFNRTRYTIQVIDKNPDSEIPIKVLDLFPYSRFSSEYVIDNLYHFQLNVYNGGN